MSSGQRSLLYKIVKPQSHKKAALGSVHITVLPLLWKPLFSLTLPWTLRFLCALVLAQAESSVIRHAEDQVGKAACRTPHITALWQLPWAEWDFCFSGPWVYQQAFIVLSSFIWIIYPNPFVWDPHLRSGPEACSLPKLHCMHVWMRCVSMHLFIHIKTITLKK